MKRFASLLLLLPLGLSLLLSAGCKRAQLQPIPAKTPEVFVSLPSRNVVTDYEEFTGRTMAVETVTVRPRVSGYVDRVTFKDGDFVKAGDLLFEIDARPFRAELARSIATIEQNQAHLERLKRTEERAQKLIANRTITQEEYDTAVFDRRETEAGITAAKANKDLAELNVSWTQITAKISGKISRRLVDPGNLVKADDTALATIVSLDPIYVYFDMDERTVLKLRRLAESSSSTSGGVQREVQLGLADQEDFPLKGRINFTDNQIDPSTGTLRVRAVIANPSGLLSPGLFVRLRVPVGTPREALIVKEESLGTDQGQRFVYVVNDQDEVSYRRVEAGALNAGQRVIEKGIEPSDRVVVTGLQRVRPGQKVIAKPAEEATSKAAGQVSQDATVSRTAGQAR